MSDEAAAAAPRSPLKLLANRERGARFGTREKRQAINTFIPNTHAGTFYNAEERVFCGRFSADGDIYAAASQDSMIHIFDWNRSQSLSKTIACLDVGWSIIDIDFSPDGGNLIYSSWSRCVHRFRTRDRSTEQQALDFAPPPLLHFCLFSVKHSLDGKEIVGGANDASLYVYDLGRGQRTLRLTAAHDDVNAVCFGDASGNLLISGGDDRKINVWDRRALGDGKPCGSLGGHKGGITSLDSKFDGYTVLSNGKDHTLRLWDLRGLSDGSGAAASEGSSGSRRGEGGRGANTATLRGHTVRDTLVRAYFSPAASTGRRYVYTGSSCGSVFVFDGVSGEKKAEVEAHASVVRDASWHPETPCILTASWDATVGRLEYRSAADADGEEAPPKSARAARASRRRWTRSWSDG
eukprot:tig00020537_g10253.t1